MELLHNQQPNAPRNRHRLRARSMLHRATADRTASIHAAECNDASAHRETELQTRIRILAARDDSSWGRDEMVAALVAGGVLFHSASKEELRRMTHSMMAATQEQQAKREAAEAEAALKEAAAATETSQVRTGRRVTRSAPFWARERSSMRGRSQSAVQDRGDTHRAIMSDDDDDDESLALSDDEERPTGQSAALRASFRARGAAYAARAQAASDVASQRMSQDDLLRSLLRLISNDEAERDAALLSHALSTCLSGPRAPR